MSEIVSGFTVVLAEDINEHAAEQIRHAILCLRGVISCVPIVASQIELHIARERERYRLLDILVNGGAG